MKIQQTKNRIKKIVSIDLINAFRELDKLLNPENLNTHNLFLVLDGEFRQFQKWSLQGTADSTEIRQARNDISKRLLEFVDSLENADFERTEWMLDYIYERIMVICKSQERIEYLMQFFPTQYFGSLRFDYSLQEINVEDVDILIYDDMPFIKNEDDELLQYFIKETPPVVLYFGRHSDLVWKYPEKAYATNSVFSLHARIQEMIAFLKYRKAYIMQQ